MDDPDATTTRRAPDRRAAASRERVGDVRRVDRGASPDRHRAALAVPVGSRSDRAGAPLTRAPDAPRPPIATPERETPLRDQPPAPRAWSRGDTGVEANARLTAMTAVVLLVLLAVEGLTILRVGPLLELHVAVGMVLIPVVALKVSSTLWRFARYYLGDPAYRRKGPPPSVLRVLGPFVIVLSAVVLASGVALLVGPASMHGQLLLVHRASFVLWLGAMAVHVLGHLLDTARLAPRDFYHRTRRQARRAGPRQWLVAASVALGLALVPLVLPSVHTFTTTAHP